MNVPTNDNERTRRVSDKPDFLENAKQALQISDLRGEHNLLAQQVKSSVDGFSSTLNNVQLEVRNLASKITELTGLQHGHDANNVAISKIETTVRSLSDKLDSWFSDFEDEQARKWDKYERDRDKWRSEHEADNRATREKIILWNGIAFAFVLLGGAVVGGFVWVLNMRFQTQADVTAALVDRHTTHEAQLMKSTEKLHEVELYLARKENAK